MNGSELLVRVCITEGEGTSKIVGIILVPFTTLAVTLLISIGVIGTIGLDLSCLCWVGTFK